MLPQQFVVQKRQRCKGENASFCCCLLSFFGEFSHDGICMLLCSMPPSKRASRNNGFGQSSSVIRVLPESLVISKIHSYDKDATQGCGSVVDSGVCCTLFEDSDVRFHQIKNWPRMTKWDLVAHFCDQNYDLLDPDCWLKWPNLG